MEVDWTAVEAAGLLADADDIDDRRALIEVLAAEGLSIEEMAAAHARDGLMRAGGDRYIRPGAGTYTLTEVAEQLDADPQVVRRAWRSLGAVDPGADEAIASADDVELMRTALLVLDLFGDDAGWPLLRRFGSLIERFTEATSSAVIAGQPGISTLHTGSEAATARVWNQVARFVPQLGRLMDLTLRHHIDAVRRYFEAAGAGLLSASEFELGVGFADLSGYTSTAQLLGLPELANVVGEFEARVTEVITGLGGRIVKFVGDAVLFVGHDVDGLAEMAMAIVEPTGDGEVTLSARAALTHGTVLAREGDYFGPTVNLAARLVAVTPEKSVLVDGAMREVLDPSRWRFVEQPPQELKGIGDAVSSYLLEVARN